MSMGLEGSILRAPLDISALIIADIDPKLYPVVVVIVL
jgi:hypothetical protein